MLIKTLLRFLLEKFPYILKFVRKNKLKVRQLLFNIYDSKTAIISIVKLSIVKLSHEETRCNTCLNVSEYIL